MTAHERIRQAARDGLRNYLAAENWRSNIFWIKAADATANEICRQLRQRPIQLTDEQIKAIDEGALLCRNPMPTIEWLRFAMVEFQRLYLFSEEPEAPENIKDLLWTINGDKEDAEHNASVIEAERRGFERGQRAKESEIPKTINEMKWLMNDENRPFENPNGAVRLHNTQVEEAFRLGQHAKEQE